MNDFHVGEQVYIFCYTSSIMQKGIVEKITSSGFIKVDGVLYRPNDNYERGGNRIIFKINEETTAKNRECVEKAFINSVICKIDTLLRRYDTRKAVTYEQARQLNECLNLGVEFREEDI